MATHINPDDESENALINEALDGVVEGLQLVNKRFDLFDAAAQSIRLMYDALRRAGFNERDALEIVSRQGGVKTK